MARKKLYENMTPDEQESAVRRIMEAGGSNRSAATQLGTTRGTIARIRRVKGIPSKNKPGFADVQKSSSGVLLPRTPAKLPRVRKPKTPAPLPVPGLMEAKSEASRCEYEGAYCPYEAEAGSRFCPLHDQETEERARH